jgi:hypothetical protein
MKPLRPHREDIQEAEIAEPFATLATPSLADELDRRVQGLRHAQGRSGRGGTTASNGGGSNEGQIIALTGRYLNHETAEAIRRLHRML